MLIIGIQVAKSNENLLFILTKIVVSSKKITLILLIFKFNDFFC